MRGADTSLGGLRRDFPNTTWGFLSELRATATQDQRDGLEELCRRYWKPVYRYARAAWAKSNDDAKDLTQAFFLWLIDGNALEQYNSDRGSFRNYLKLLLRHFLSHQETALQRLKRGGGLRWLSIEQGDHAVRHAVPDGQAVDPEQAFDRGWLAEVVNQAMDRLREKCTSDERRKALLILEAYDLEAKEQRPTYEELAAKFSLTWQEVRHRLVSMREELRGEIRAELARMTRDARELEEEWNALFGSRGTGSTPPGRP